MPPKAVAVVLSTPRGTRSQGRVNIDTSDYNALNLGTGRRRRGQATPAATVGGALNNGPTNAAQTPAPGYNLGPPQNAAPAPAPNPVPLQLPAVPAPHQANAPNAAPPQNPTLPQNQATPPPNPAPVNQPATPTVQNANPNVQDATPPGPAPDPDDGADNETAPQEPEDRRKGSFWETLGVQIRKGMKYIARRQTGIALALAMILLQQQLCSAGSLCKDNNVFWMILLAFIGNPMSYICLVIANTLTIAGMIDAVEGFFSIAKEMGHRAVRPEEEPTSFWESFFFMVGAIHEKVTAPILVLLLTCEMGYQYLEQLSKPIRFVLASSVLHLVKWVLQALAVHDEQYFKKEWAQELQKHLFLLTLTVVAIWTMLSYISYLIWSVNDLVRACIYSTTPTSREKAVLPVVIEKLFVAKEEPSRTGADEYMVTHKVVTKWVGSE